MNSDIVHYLLHSLYVITRPATTTIIIDNINNNNSVFIGLLTLQLH